MSLIFAEGFENYGTSGRPPFYKYSANTNAIHNTLTTGRFHGYGWRMGSTFMSAFDELYTNHIVPVGNDTFYMGLAIRKRSTTGMTSGYSRFFMSFLDNLNGAQASLAFNASNENIIEAYSGVTNTLRGSGTFITDTNWHYMEFGCRVHTSTGWIEVRLDGATVIRFDGNTRFTAQNDITKIRIRSPFNYSNWTIDIDDWYVNDATGSVNNGFLGEISIESLMPTADGFHGDMTPSTAGTSFNLVNEEPPNGTNFITANGVGQRETFVTENLSYLTGVNGVWVECIARNDGIAPNEVRSVTRISGTTYTPSVTGPILPINPSNYFSFGQAFNVNPATSAAWTAAEVNAAEFGLELEA